MCTVSCLKVACYYDNASFNCCCDEVIIIRIGVLLSYRVRDLYLIAGM